MIVPVSGRKDVGKSIPEAEFFLIDGMGYNYHPQVYNQIIKAVVKITRKKY